MTRCPHCGKPILSPRQQAVLEALPDVGHYRDAGITIQQITDSTGIPRTPVRSCLGKLVALGLVEQEMSRGKQPQRFRRKA